MNASTFRKTAIAAIAALALIGAGSVVAPTQAQAGDKHVAGALIGGLVLGAIIGSHAQPGYAQPYYGQPHYVQPSYGVTYGPRCHWQKQRVWNPYYGHYIWRKARVCY
ncbi:MAG: hypothetical protein WBO55_05680 [Rhizobiaceae bacterium]